jgi:hypothetical protein
MACFPALALYGSPPLLMHPPMNAAAAIHTNMNNAREAGVKREDSWSMARAGDCIIEMALG